MKDRRQRAFAGDRLYFDGYDLGHDRTSRRAVYDDGYDDYISEDEYRDQRDLPPQYGTRMREDSLVHAALDRIQQARVNGKTNVNLTRDEMEALERRGSQQPEPSTALVSPPSTPAKSRIKASSRTSSTSSLTAQKGRKKSSSFFGSPAKSNSKAKVSRKNSVDYSVSNGAGNVPSGMVYAGAGPSGAPLYAPVGYYAPPSPEVVRTRSGESRSSSKQSRRESTPPEQMQPAPVRYYSPGRPDSQGSYRSQPDEVDWYPPAPPPRHRSVSNAQLSGGYRRPDDYDMAAPMPAEQGRRHVSGPPDVRYSSLRRMPPSSSPLAQRASPAPGSSNLRRVDTSGSSSSEGQGVEVNIVPDANGGYSIRSAPALAAAPPVVASSSSSRDKESGNGSRKRRTGRR